MKKESFSLVEEYEGSSCSPVRTRVLIVDDQPLMRDALREAINRTQDMVCCGEADNCSAALSLALEQKPEFVIMDLRLRNGDSLELIKEIRFQLKDVKILVLSEMDEMVFAVRTLRAGARGYAMKNLSTRQLLAVCRIVMEGGYYMSDAVRLLTMQSFAGDKTEVAGERTRSVESLTDRELQVMVRLGRGLVSRQIASDLGLSIKTIHSYRENIKKKLGLSDGSMLVREAVLWGRNSDMISQARKSFP